jgi:hypothetical protein
MEYSTTLNSHGNRNPLRYSIMAFSGRQKAQKTAKATRARRLIGKNTDARILGVIEKHPGISLYEIQKLTSLSMGLIGGSVTRLEKSARVRTSHILRGGRSVSKIFPADVPEPRNSEIKVEKNAFLRPEKWTDTAYLYALNRSSISVAPEKEPEWDSLALLKDQVELKKDDSHIIFDVPSKFRDFYLFQNSKVDVSTVGELILLNFVTEIPIAPQTENEKADYLRASPTNKWRGRSPE